MLLMTAGWICPAAAQGPVTPGQPFAPHWFPNDLLKWTATADPDAEYNRSRVPLATRFHNPKTQVNSHARPGEARIASLAAFGPTSKNPSQGEAVFSTYTATYWQYTDVLVCWGGSSGEGLILAPKPTVTDAAHRNGVPVLGTVFFPPVVYGGKIEWLRDLVQKRGDSFPVADKLIEVAKYYGFDGWFFNQETDGADARLVGEVQEFLRYLQKKSSLRVMWYDAMNKNGAVGWQGALNEQNSLFFQDGGLVSNNLFLDFRWRPERLVTSRAEALRLSRSPYDLYAGIDVEGAGYNKNVRWESLFPEDQPHNVSVGFYRPEWTFHSAKDSDDFYIRESRFWVGANGDPGNTSTDEPWKGIAHYIPEQSPITTLPFVTNFNTGQGHQFAVNGSVVGHADWNSLSLQDILPTWRWSIESGGGKLRPEFDWKESFNGGTSLKVSGVLNAPNHLKLFSTRLKIGPKTVIRIAYKTGRPMPAHLQAGLDFDRDPARFEYLDVGAARGSGWNVVTLPLAKYVGQTLSVISLRFASETPLTDYAIHIGQIAVLDAGTTAAPKPPTNLRIERQWNAGDRASFRLRWTPASGPVHAYNIYRKEPGGARVHLGSTPNNVYFVRAIPQKEREAAATIFVEAVNTVWMPSKPVSVRLPWPKP
ncbi:MAG: glycoside hydrolase [Armatimonadota bacterium]